MAENNAEIVNDINNNEAQEVMENSNQENQNQNELLDMVFTLESEKQQLVEESRKRISALRKELEVSFCRFLFLLMTDGIFAIFVFRNLCWKMINLRRKLINWNNP